MAPLPPLPDKAALAVLQALHNQEEEDFRAVLAAAKRGVPLEELCRLSDRLGPSRFTGPRKETPEKENAPGADPLWITLPEHRIPDEVPSILAESESSLFRKEKKNSKNKKKSPNTPEPEDTGKPSLLARAFRFAVLGLVLGFIYVVMSPQGCSFSSIRRLFP